ncbi:MAG: lipid-A-disaccharide synthase [gamma proteobacterium symbiont of Taylorina sp.]|nr:lipid-A-disaccharide synthase [gamma proteobacterium symbiont of Taylorina sp.]
MRIGIIAGEASGDILASGLINAILESYPHAEFEGIAGPLMIKAGCKALYPAEKLSVMGLVEVLSHYRELSNIRQSIIQHFIDSPPDVFIGVDAPDFNLGVEAALKAAGIGTIHYVSPSVWAWRQYRLGKISRAVDLMLTLFPFEARFYENHNILVKYVGHTLADEISSGHEKPQAIAQARQTLALDIGADQSLIAVLPGSRMSEVTRLSKPFIATLLQCLQVKADLSFIIPLINNKTRYIFEEELARQTGDNPQLQAQFIIIDGHSREAMAASNAVLLASGTAALEALLLKKPMIVAYKLSPITYWIAKRLLNVPYYSLPNLLADEYLVEEITQNDVCPEVLAPKVLGLLSAFWDDKLKAFNDIHILLRQSANQSAAKAVIDYIRQGSESKQL